MKYCLSSIDSPVLIEMLKKRPDLDFSLVDIFPNAVFFLKNMLYTLWRIWLCPMKIPPHLWCAESRASGGDSICPPTQVLMTWLFHAGFHVTSGIAAGDFTYCIYLSNLSRGYLNLGDSPIAQWTAQWPGTTSGGCTSPVHLMLQDATTQAFQM